MTKKVSTTVYVDPQQKAGLEALKNVMGVSEAELIRQGIDMVIEKEERKVRAINWKTYESYVDDWEDHGTHWVGFLTDDQGNRHAVGFINKKAVEKLKLLRERK